MAGGLPCGAQQGTHSGLWKEGSVGSPFAYFQSFPSLNSSPPSPTHVRASDFQELMPARDPRGRRKQYKGMSSREQSGTYFQLPFFFFFFQEMPVGYLCKLHCGSNSLWLLVVLTAWVAGSMLRFGKDLLNIYDTHASVRMYTHVHVQKQIVVRVWGVKHWLRSIFGTNTWRGREGDKRQERKNSGYNAGPVAETPWGLLELEWPSELSQIGPRWAGLYALTWLRY